MYPEIIIGGTPYLIDFITPLIGLVLLVFLLYKITKSLNLRFRDIVSKLPMIVAITLLCSTYTNFVFQSDSFLPTSWLQLSSLFSFSVSSIDFVGLLAGAFISSMIALKQMPSKVRSNWGYVLMLTYVGVLIILGICYTLGDSVIGKLNEGFFSIGSFVSQSRIAQLGGSVYPVGLLISAWSVCCVVIGRLLRRYHPGRAGYLLCAIFLLGYCVILHYQHYPRHLLVNLGSFQIDLRGYLCIAIACITGYFGYKAKKK